MSINKSFLRRKLLFPLAWYFSYIRAMCLIYNWWLPCMSVCGDACMFMSLWELLLVCVGDLFLARFLCCQSILCVEWLPVIASLELCLLPNRATAVALPALSHSLSFFLTPACLLSFSLFVIFWFGISCQKGDTRALRLVVSLICFFFIIIISFPLKGIQPWNNQCRSSWNSCQSGWQLPFIRHVTTKSRGCDHDDRSAVSLCMGPAYYKKNILIFLCLCGASWACCAQCGVLPLASHCFLNCSVLFSIDYLLHDLFFFVLFTVCWIWCTIWCIHTGDCALSFQSCVQTIFNKLGFSINLLSRLFDNIFALDVAVLLHLYYENKWP